MKKPNRATMTDFYVYADTHNGEKRFWVIAANKEAASEQVRKNFTHPALDRFARPFKVEKKVDVNLTLLRVCEILGSKEGAAKTPEIGNVNN